VLFERGLGIARICNVMVQKIKCVEGMFCCVWGLPGFVMSWYLKKDLLIMTLSCLGIARICNVMVRKMTYVACGNLSVWGLPGFVMSWYFFSFNAAIDPCVSGDCPDL